MLLTKDALTQCGYNVISVKWPDHMWTDARDLFMTLIANDVSPPLIRDTDDTYEKFLPSLESSRFIQRAWPITRYLIDKMLHRNNNARNATMMKFLRTITPKEFDKCLIKLS